MSREYFDSLSKQIKTIGDQAINAEIDAAVEAGYLRINMRLIIQGPETRLLCGSVTLARQTAVFEGVTVRVETERLWSLKQ